MPLSWYLCLLVMKLGANLEIYRSPFFSSTTLATRIESGGCPMTTSISSTFFDTRYHVGDSMDGRQSYTDRVLALLENEVAQSPAVGLENHREESYARWRE